MRLILLFALFVIAISCRAADLAPIKDQNLANILYNLEEVTGDDTSSEIYDVRVFVAPAELSECGGTVESCPDVYLYVVVASDGLGNKPTLYRLPVAKGWKLDKWLGDGVAKGQEGMVGFRVETAIPDANIDEKNYKAWSPTVYEVWVSPEKATIAVK